MKSHLLATAAALGLAATAHAQFSFTDTFTSGSPADAGYYRFGTTNTTLSVDGGDLDFAQTTGALARSGTYKQFSSQTLAVGESITFSFDVTASNFPSSVNHVFRWAIGTTPLVNPAADLGSNTPFESGTRQMFQFAASNSATTGFGQFVAGSTSPVHNQNGTATQMTGFTGPANLVKNFTGSVSLTITRTDTNNYSISQTAFGVSSAGTLTGVGFNQFNTIAFGVNTTGDASFSLDNISVSVIPEPSSFAALAGLGALGMVASRRRRRA